MDHTRGALFFGSQNGVFVNYLAVVTTLIGSNYLSFVLGEGILGRALDLGSILQSPQLYHSTSYKLFHRSILVE
jgi:hypothetical protein